MAKPTICMSSRHQKTPCFLWTPTLTSYAFDPFANIQKFPEKTTYKFSWSILGTFNPNANELKQLWKLLRKIFGHDRFKYQKSINKLPPKMAKELPQNIIKTII